MGQRRELVGNIAKKSKLLMVTIIQHSSGINTVLFRLDDLQSHTVQQFPTVSPQDKDRCLAEAQRYILPNGLEIAHLKPYETNYLYNEIFVEKTYLKHDIELPDGATVLDIGANIGMFSLFVIGHCKNPKLFSFEPSPITFEVLKKNLALYSPKSIPCNVGIADSDREAEFTFYPHSSVFSGFFADDETDGDALRQAMENELIAKDQSKESVQAHLDQMVKDRLKKETYRCQLRSLSSLFTEHQIERVDLLKIDAEKCEWDILQSIQDAEWKKIRQVVIEVHDKEGKILTNIQTLLQEKGFIINVVEEELLEKSGLYNIYGKRAAKRQLSSALGIENNLNELLSLLQTVHKTFQVPLLLGICPASPQLRATLSDQVIQRLESLIWQTTNELNQITTVRFSDYESLWGDYYDAVRDEMGHIPYTPDFYTAMATVLVRQAHALNRPVYKVIALDCDNTLWSGVVGEQGVDISLGFDALQQFIVEQKRQGMLICLVSKNNEADVKSVFSTHKDMKLQWKDIAAWKINWLPKSQNLRELAQELNVGLDSIIFLDDNPVECAEVKANCPEVLTLQLPAQSNDIADFLNHVWAFDKVNSNTREDSQRTELYQQNAKREQFRKTALTFKDFIADLNLEITITPAQPTDYVRIAQLTHRTNQFNSHKIPQSESDIEEMLTQPSCHCDVVRVTDRFGDYGLCGVLIYSEQRKKLKLKTVLLSCRALGRGVEHQMLAFLGKEALKRQRKRADILFVPTEKNRAMETFLQTIGAPYRTQKVEKVVYKFPAEQLSKLVFSPPEQSPENDSKIPINQSQTSQVNDSELMQRIANQRSCPSLPVTANAAAQSTRLFEDTAHYITTTILKNVCTILAVEESSFSPTEAFSDLGLDSWGNIDLIVKLNETFGIELPTTTLFDYTCVADLSNYIMSEYGEIIAQNNSELAKTEPSDATESPITQQTKTVNSPLPPVETSADRPSAQRILDNEKVAVIGMSGRFPGANTIEEFWQLLIEGKSGITEVPPQRWDVVTHYDPDRQIPNKTYSKWGGFLKDIDGFDAPFFKISRREAQQIDPQQRFFLEESWRALEHAGYINTENNRWGVFVGADAGDYHLTLQQAGIPLEAPAFMGNHASVLAARIAYYLNLKGAALAVDTACSSSLAAVHLACESLLNGEMELALAGGVSIRTTANFFILSSKAGMLAGDDKNKTFDNRADGFVPGEAVGVVVLKRLTDALADNDTIYGVIEGSAMNQDGKTNGITAPSGLSQTELALNVYKKSGINPSDITYVEAHGTGTKLGDPIEVNALTAAFRHYTDQKTFCAIGSAKSNIGHCTHAAGVCGLMKLLLCLHFKKLVPTISFEQANQHIAFDSSPFFVNTAVQDWNVAPNKQRIGTVSSFGFSGTNVHIVVSEAPASPVVKDRQTKPFYLVTLSAKTTAALNQRCEDLAQWLEGQELADICYTLSLGRRHFEKRWALVVSQSSELKTALKQIQSGETPQNLLTGNDAGVTAADKAIYKQVLKKVTDDLSQPNGIDTDKYHDLLMALGGLYVKGYVSEIPALYSDQPYRRIALPSYPFAKERYWATPVQTKDVPKPHTQKYRELAASAIPLAPDTLKKPTGISLPAIQASVPATLQPLVNDGGTITPAVDSVNYGDGVFGLQITSPTTQNRLSEPLINDIQQELVKLKTEPQLNVLILSGLDSWFLTGGRSEYNDVLRHKLHLTIAEFPMPTIAALKGDATGVGMLLAALCDFMICGQDSQYSYTDPIKGIFPTAPEEALWIERFGQVQAREFLYQSSALTGKCLQQKGWRCLVEPPSQVESAARKLATDLAGMPQQSLHLLKRRLSANLLNRAKALSSAEVLSAQGSLNTVFTITSSSPLLHLEIYDSVLWVKMLPSRSATQLLVEALEELFSQIANSTQVSVVVISGINSDVIAPQALSLIHRLTSLFLDASVPVIAALESDTRHIAWFIALFCDACFYSDSGRYAMGNIAEYHLLAKEIVTMVSLRFEAYLGQEMVFTGTEYSGQELHQRVKTLNVVPTDQVLKTSLSLAKSWSKLPPDTRTDWKRRNAATIRSQIAQRPEFKTEQEEKPPAQFTEMASKVIQATIDPEGIVTVKMEDREAKNMFSEAFIQGVTEVFQRIERTQGIKVVILTGFDTYFSAGGTQEGLQAIQDGRIKYSDAPIFQLPMLCKVPVIAAMQGHAIGGGWALGMFADFILYSDESVYSCNFMRFGFTPGAGSTLLFPWHLGNDLSNEILFTAKDYKGADLRHRGISMPVLPRRQMLESAKALAKKIVQLPSQTIVALKQLFTHHLRDQLEETYRLELAMHEKTFVNNANTLSKIRSNFSHGLKGTPENQSVQSSTEVLSTPHQLPAICATLKKLLAEELYMAESEIGNNTQFVDLGLDSITGVTWIQKVNREYGTSMAATKVYAYPTLSDMSEYIFSQVAQQPVSSLPKTPVKDSTESESSIQATLKKMLAEELYLDESEIRDDAQFVDLGLDSITGVTWIQKINSEYGTSIAATKVYVYPTLSEMSHYVKTQKRAIAPSSLAPESSELPATPESVKKAPYTPQVEPTSPQKTNSAIAIIGMAGKFPQADNLQTFWENIISGKDCVTEIPADRWEMDTDYRWMGAIEGYDRFDASFFNISASKAESMEPQQRLFLETCWHSIEDSGTDPTTLSGTNCGVFVGCVANDYGQLTQDGGLTANGLMGGATSVLSARIAYFLNLQGPCLSIDTACSSSLVAIANACDSLMTQNCDAALAGGVFMMPTPSMHIMTSKSGMLSKAGRCFTFDQRADGFVPAESVGVLFLKRLEDAQRDNDPIQGIIHGWGVNQDGKTNGINAGNPHSQTRLQRKIYDRFQINPERISLIEAHGTGTKLGDAMEVEGLIDTFKHYTQQTNYCALGAVKSNIGHSLTAAGVAGVIKLLLAFKHKKLPPTIHVDQLNEFIGLTGSPFYINTTTKEWDAPDQSGRWAAINSFGLNGTNAHIVMSEPMFQPVSKNRETLPNTEQVLTLSAQTPSQLIPYARRVLAYIDETPHLSLVDFLATFQVGRPALKHRVAMVVSDRKELMQTLRSYIEGQSPANLFTGKANLSDATDVINTLIDHRNFKELAKLWADGNAIDWAKLYSPVQRLSGLPCYPFAQERYWVSTSLPTLDRSAELSSVNEELSLKTKTLMFVKRLVAEQLSISPNEIDADQGFFEMGLSSLQLLKMTQEIKKTVDSAFSPVLFYETLTPQALTSHLVNTYHGASEPTLVITPYQADRYAPFPLSDIQESFLVGRKIGTSVGCHVYFEMAFEKLDIYRLNTAWQRLIDYHDMLRAVILPSGLQNVLSDVPKYKIKVSDLRRKNQAEQTQYLTKLRDRMSQQVYTGEQWPLFDVRISICSDRQVVHFSIDELIIDASALGMLLQQWKKLYTNPDWELPKLTLSFRDFMVATKKLENSPQYQRDIDYWLTQLNPLPPGPQLPLNPRLAVETRIRLKGALKSAQWQPLKRTILSLNCSPTAFLLIVFAEVLRLWGRPQKACSIILTLFNRLNHPELDQILGPFITTNIFVKTENNAAPIAEQLQSAQKRLLTDLDHTTVSGIRVLRTLKKQGSISNTLSLPVVFTSLLGNKDWKTDDSFFEAITYFVSQTPQVYLDHQVYEHKGELRFNWDVARDYFAPGVINALFSDYTRALGELASTTDRWATEPWIFRKSAADQLRLETFPEKRFIPFPLTDQQQAYAFGRSQFGAQMSPQFYICFEAENLDVPRLEKAWQKVMERHEMLITVIQPNGTQQIQPKVPKYKIEVTDLRRENPKVIEDTLNGIESSMVTRFCPLGEWPYFELRVSRINDTVSRIHFSIDLMIADGTSLDLLQKELFHFYENPTAPVQKYTISFCDYILSLQEYQKTDGYQASFNYWKNKFVDIPSGPDLPMIGHTPAPKTERIQGVLKPWNVLKKMAQNMGVTPSMLLLAAYAEVLAAWSASESFSIVIPSWERPQLHPEINELVGDFTAMSWVVVSKAEKPFEEKVRDYFSTVQEDLSHMAVSGLKALRTAVSKNKHNRKTLSFPIVFSNLTSGLQLPKGFKNVKSLSQTPQVHLDNISSEQGEHLRLNWDVTQGLFPEGMMQAMFKGYQRILEHLAATPDSLKDIHFKQLINAKARLPRTK
jgi:FkbH-like protein/FkbM family methyltransferase